LALDAVFFSLRCTLWTGNWYCKCSRLVDIPQQVEHHRRLEVLPCPRLLELLLLEVLRQ